MNVRRSLLLILCLLMCGLCAYAQNGEARLVGKVFERKDVGRSVVSDAVLDIPVGDARIVLQTADSTYVSISSLTGATPGGFVFEGVKPGAARLTIVHKDFKTFSETATLEPGDNVAMIALIPTDVSPGDTLVAAVVTEEAPLITFRGDTLVYHAAKMDIREGDFVIDVIKNLPGVQYDNHVLQIDGKVVVRTYVNGSLIFGTNPMAAMNNLGAQQLVTMDVYDEDHPGDYLYGTTSLKDRVVNLKTKDPIFSVFDIQALASGGADALASESGSRQYRYALGTNAKFFSEMRQATADIVGSNLGIESSEISIMPSILTNYRENKNAKIVYNQYWKNVLFGNALELSYDYRNDWNRNRSRRLSEFYAVGNVPGKVTEELSRSSNTQTSHSATSNLRVTSWKHLQLTWQNSVSLSESSSRNTQEGYTMWEGMAPMRRNEEIGNEISGWNISESVLLTPKIGDKSAFTAILKFESGRTMNDSWDVDTLATSYFRRNLVKDSGIRNMAYGLTLRKNLDLKNKKSLSLEYILKYARNSNVQMAYDIDAEGNMNRNSFNTFDYTHSTYTSSLRVSSSLFRGNTFSMSAAVTPTAQWIGNMERSPDLQTSRTYLSLLPEIGITYKRENPILQYTASSTVPSIQQVRDRIDDTDAMRIRAGKPDLRNSLTHSFSSHYSKTIKSSSFRYNASLQIVDRPILNKTIYYNTSTTLPDYNNYKVPAGATFTTYVNGPANYSADLTLDYSTRFRLFKGLVSPNLSLTPSIRYSNNAAYYGDLLDRTLETTHGIAFYLDSPLGKWLRVSLKDNVQDIHGSNRSGTMSRHILKHTASANIDLTLFKKMKWSTKYSRDMYRPVGNGGGKAVDIHRLNVDAGIDLFRNRCRITLSGYDLLSGGSEYSERFTESSYVRTWTPAYGRFYLLKLTYRFNNTNGRLMPSYSIF